MAAGLPGEYSASCVCLRFGEQQGGPTMRFTLPDYPPCSTRYSPVVFQLFILIVEYRVDSCRSGPVLPRGPGHSCLGCAHRCRRRNVDKPQRLPGLHGDTAGCLFRSRSMPAPRRNTRLTTWRKGTPTILPSPPLINPAYESGYSNEVSETISSSAVMRLPSARQVPEQAV